MAVSNVAQSGTGLAKLLGTKANPHASSDLKAHSQQTEQDEQSQRLQDARDALKVGTSLVDSLKKERKSRSTQKVEEIKQKIRDMAFLRLLNPEQYARTIANLSKELASAARDYAQGSTIGNSTNAALQSSDATASAMQSSLAQASSATAAGAVVAPSPATAAATPTPQTPPPAAVPAPASSPSTSPEAANQDQTNTEQNKDGSSSFQDAAKAIAETIDAERASQLSHYQALSSEKAADQRFSDDVKALARRLKVLFDAAIKDAKDEQARKEHLDALRREFETSQAHTAQSVNDIAGATPSVLDGGLSVDVSLGVSLSV